MIILHANTSPFCCNASKTYSLKNTMFPLHGMNSEVIIGSNYVRYYNGKYPDPYLYGTVLKTDIKNIIISIHYTH